MTEAQIEVFQERTTIGDRLWSWMEKGQIRRYREVCVGKGEVDANENYMLVVRRRFWQSPVIVRARHSKAGGEEDSVWVELDTDRGTCVVGTHVNRGYTTGLGIDGVLVRVNHLPKDD